MQMRIDYGKVAPEVCKAMMCLVFKNNALAFVEREMKAAGSQEFATDLHNPDFAKMAGSAGLLGLTAETPDQVRPMIMQAQS